MTTERAAEAASDAARAQHEANATVLVTFDAVWTGDGFRGATAYRLRGERLHRLGAAPVGSSREADPHLDLPRLHLPGTLFPRLTDHHVHLGLADRAALFSGGITHAHDLGWIPAVAATWLTAAPHHPETTIAGALLTAPGGYPVRSGWAPPGAAREVGGPRDGRRAVREQVMSGASRIKVALNSDAGETVDDATLSAIVDEAVNAGVPVVAHAQGGGQAERAVWAGIHALAHTPFSERLADRVIAEAVRRGVRWISTLDIHGWGAPSLERAIAIENLRRFHAAGGEVLYGTDLGNGPLPVGVNARELAALREAGLDATKLLRSIAGGRDGWGLQADAPVGPRLAWVPGTPPAEAADLPAWLATARGLHLSDLAPAQRTTPTADPGAADHDHHHDHDRSAPAPADPPPPPPTEGPRP